MTLAPRALGCEARTDGLKPRKKMQAADAPSHTAVDTGAGAVSDSDTDRPSGQKEIRKINISLGERERIEKIELCFSDGSSVSHGDNSGEPQPPFVLQPGEKLVRIRTLQGCSLDGCQFYTDSGRVSQWFGGTGRGGVPFQVAGLHAVPGCFEGSAEDPILDIERATGICARIISIVKASGSKQKEIPSVRAHLLELLNHPSVAMDPDRSKLLRDAANIDPHTHVLKLTPGKQACSVCLEATLSRGALCCMKDFENSGEKCEKWVCESCYSTLLTRHLAKPVLMRQEHGFLGSSSWMAPNSLQHKAAVFCLSQFKANEGPGAKSVVPCIPEQEVLRRIIELADPWYGQDEWDLCTVCDKILCPSCQKESQDSIQDWRVPPIRDPDLPCCLPCADMFLGDEDDYSDQDDLPWDFLQNLSTEELLEIAEELRDDEDLLVDSIHDDQSDGSLQDEDEDNDFSDIDDHDEL